MEELPLVLGIDSSTQGTSAVLLDRRDFSVAAEARVRYRDDPRLSAFGLGGETPLLPEEEEGSAHQPAALYLAALEALLEDLPAGLRARVGAVNLSAQQHGQVWVGAEGLGLIRGLGERGAGARGSLAALLAPGLAWERAPIWMSSSAGPEAAALRRAAGGAEAVTALSGSDSPLRFSGAVAAHEARRHPEAWARTARLHLISSFLCGVLAANPDCPIDWGNGSGSGLMDWAGRHWSPLLLGAASALAGGGELGTRLPPLAHPQSRAGRLAAWFVERFGMSPACEVLIGSGDNPQSRTLVEGSLLSLGTSFVIMAGGRRPHVAANAMYDGLGRPFLFGCRTNGALAWEALRRRHGLGPEDFAASDRALGSCLPGRDGRGAELAPRLFQPESESFPPSLPLDIGATGDFEADYAGAVDSSLGLLYLASRPFAEPPGEIAVTGGGAASPEVLARVAALWACPARPLSGAGAATGAAFAAALALLPERERAGVEAGTRARLTGARPPVEPRAELLRAYHGEGGYLAGLRKSCPALGIGL